jgi:predicted amidohydrolase
MRIQASKLRRRSDETAPRFEPALQDALSRRPRGNAARGHEAAATPKRRLNLLILVGPDGRVVLKYRKVYLPGIRL